MEQVARGTRPRAASALPSSCRPWGVQAGRVCRHARCLRVSVGVGSGDSRPAGPCLLQTEGQLP